MHPKRLSHEEARTLLDAGQAVVVDVRESPEFARLHIAGAISVPFSEKGLADRIAIALPPASRVILLAPDERELTSAIKQVRDSAFELLGVIENVDPWSRAGFPTGTINEVPVEELAERDGVLVDVREPFEWEMGYAAGARFMPLSAFRKHLAELPRGEQITIICEAGIRSSTAASILLAEGYENVAHVPQGMRGYRRARLPLVFPEGTTV